MKLKHKLILIVSLVIAVSLATVGTVLMLLMRSSLLRDAYSEAAVNAVEAYAALERRVETGGGKNDASLAVIYKSADNWKNVVCKGEEEIYNITVFSKADLDRVAQQDDDGAAPGDKTDSREELVYEDGRYIVNTRTVGDYQLYRLYDITDVHIRIRTMIRNYALIALGILAAAVLITALAVRKVLRPLESLTQATRDMAEGDYTRRVPALTKDELGDLAVHFNEMAEAVEQKAGNLRESEERKTLMMGNLSHELKTPMTAIAGYAETLLTTKLSEEQQSEALYYIYTETKRLGRLSNKMMQLLNLAEGEAVEKTDVDVAELFRSVEETVAVKCRERDVRLVCEIVPGDGDEDDGRGDVVHTDEDLIRDVLINLVDNAIKASHEGGRVWLVWKDGVFTVRDEGIGIPAEELDAITEPFYMVDKSRSREEGGAGLGLSLTKLILEKLGAKMKIESQVGEGTTAEVSMP